MPTNVQAPDGSIVEFPDGVSHDVMEAAMREHFPPPKEGSVYSAELQRYLTPEEAQARSHATTVEMNAQRNNSEQSGWLQSFRSMFRHAPAGWGPEVTGQITSAINGEDPKLRAEIERRQDDLNYQEHPTRNMITGGLGSALGITFAGAGLGGLPITGPALEAGGNLLSRIPAMTQGGQIAARNALNAGQRVPTTLGRATATAGVIGAPLGASEKMADDGVSLENAAHGAGEGFLGGAATGGLLHGGAAVVGPWASEAAQRLIDSGVRLTPGQTMGGLAQRAESAVSGLPFTGHLIRGGMERAKGSLNEVTANRALAPIGEALPQGTAPGHATVDHVFDRLGERYDNLLPHLSAPESEFRDLRANGNPTRWYDDVSDIQHTARENGLRGQGRQVLDDAVQSVRDRIADATQQNGRVNGQTLKAIQSDLAGDARAYRRSNDPSHNKVAPYLERLRTAFNDLIERENPTHAGELGHINDGYAVAAILRSAANKAGTNDGNYSAAQLSRAVQQQDSSVGKGQFARGQARLQDISRDAAPVMRTVNDSGTPERTAMQEVARGIRNGGLETLAYGGAHAAAGPLALAPLALAATLYNPVSKSIFRGLASEWRNQGVPGMPGGRIPLLPENRTVVRNALRANAAPVAAGMGYRGAQRVNALMEPDHAP